MHLFPIIREILFVVVVVFFNFWAEKFCLVVSSILERINISIIIFNVKWNLINEYFVKRFLENFCSIH